MNYYTKELNIDNKWEVKVNYKYSNSEDVLLISSFGVDSDTICTVEVDYIETQLEKWLEQELLNNRDKYLEDEILVDSDKKLKYSKENEE